jgi:hypothetical protein
MAHLVPCLVRLRADFDWLFPDRDKASDGWIGDPAHAARDSDHNPDERGLVHAIDVDRDLSPNGDMQAFVDHLVAREDPRLTYIIFNRRIWSASREWKPRTYTGPNPHTGHAHFSADDTPARENDTRSYHLEEVPVALTAADKDWIKTTVEQAVDARVGDVVPRLGPDRKPVPDTDDNPTMGVDSALFYLARDLADVKAAIRPA